jgi:outer membrane protein assembly factor BamB
MSSDITLAPSSGEPQSAIALSPKPLRVWPVVVVLGLYWNHGFVLRAMEAEMFTHFLAALAAVALLSLFFIVWWLTNRRIGRAERWACLAIAVGCGVISAFLSLKVGVIAWVLMTLPWVVTAWTAWLLVARKASARTRRLGVVAVLVLTWSVFPLIRFEGLRGDGEPIMHWRWTPSAEDLYRADRAERERRQAELPLVPPVTSLTVQPSDWPGFRGSERDGVVRSLTMKADWNASPRALWRQRVGPGWSSMAVVGDRLFTQEQRDNFEAVVCLDAATGHEVWVHSDAVRFSDDQAGPGPRATPTFADGRLYTLGATGILNCLDAVTGERQWYHDLVSEMGAKKPIWGFSCSPLIVQGRVVVFAEGDGGKTLLAYDVPSGNLAWTADAGTAGYGSPQRASLDGVEQVLFVSVNGLIGVDPTSGKVLWQHKLPAGGLMRPLQPHPLGNGRVLLASDSDGLRLLDVKRNGESWAVSQQWASRAFRPSFNDFVIHDGSIYGFDGNIFCCVDAQTGQRRWKDGRYGHGQVLLLAEPALLLVLSEQGEAILLKANPNAHEEVGRFKAIEGKTWNHPAIAGGRLYVRNAEEMACYRLAKP